MYISSVGTNPFGTGSDGEEERVSSGYRVSPLGRPSPVRSTTSGERGSTSTDHSPRIQRAHGLRHITHTVLVYITV